MSCKFCILIIVNGQALPIKFWNWEAGLRTEVLQRHWIAKPLFGSLFLIILSASLWRASVSVDFLSDNICYRHWSGEGSTTRPLAFQESNDEALNIPKLVFLRKFQNPIFCRLFLHPEQQVFLLLRILQLEMQATMNNQEQNLFFISKESHINTQLAYRIIPIRFLASYHITNCAGMTILPLVCSGNWGVVSHNVNHVIPVSMHESLFSAAKLKADCAFCITMITIR